MGTHLNAYREEAVTALKKAHEAVAEAEAKLDDLFTEVEAKLEPTGVPVAPVQTAPEAPADPEAPAKSKSSK